MPVQVQQAELGVGRVTEGGAGRREWSSTAGNRMVGRSVANGEEGV